MKQQSVFFQGNRSESGRCWKWLSARCNAPDQMTDIDLRLPVLRHDFPKQIRALSSVSASSVSAIWGVVQEKRGETEGVCHRFETLLSSALRGVFCC